MNWFKKQGDRFKGTGDREPNTNHQSPITNHQSPNSPFNYFLFLFLAFSVAVVLMKTGVLQAGGTAAALFVGVLLGLFTLVYKGWQTTRAIINGFAEEIMGGGGHAGGDRCRASRGRRPQWSSYQLEPQSLSGMLVMTGNGEEPNRQDKNKYADHEKQEAVHGREIINDYAASSLTGGGLYKVESAIWQRIRRPRLSSPFSVTSFGGMKENAEYNQTYPQDTQKYSKGEWKFFKEITCQTDSKNGFTEIGNSFRNEFSSGVVNNCFHRSNNIIREWGCQAECLSGARP